LQIALLVVGSGLCGSIYVVCPPMLGEFTPGTAARRGDRDLRRDLHAGGHFGAIGDGAVIQHAAAPIEGYMTGFTINAAVMATSGLLGLLLLWPNTERARLLAQAAQPKYA